jgi:hypothetical protein
MSIERNANDFQGIIEYALNPSLPNNSRSANQVLRPTLLKNAPQWNLSRIVLV